MYCEQVSGALHLHLFPLTWIQKDHETYPTHFCAGRFNRILSARVCLYNLDAFEQKRTVCGLVNLALKSPDSAYRDIFVGR